jgi:DNA-binding HxlR family transcriptional regulator
LLKPVFKGAFLAKRLKSSASPLSHALKAIGDPWSFLIHQEAFFGVRRFDDFQRNLNIARNTLTDRLALLIKCDLLKKEAYQARPRRYEYRLTARGLDTYPYALSLMKWGDEWLPNEKGPPVRLRHKTCNKLLRPSAICEACRREVRAEDVSINPLSAKDPAPEHSAQVRYSSRPELYTAGRSTSVGGTLAAIGDRWGFFVLWLAFAGITKFDHFHRILGIARTTLTARLDRVVQQGLLDRVLYQDRPPRHDYHLTSKGKALCPVLLTLFDWGKRGLGTEMTDASVLHKSCGKPLRILVICENCKEVANPHEVEVMKRNERSKSSSLQDPTLSTPSDISLSVRSKAGSRKKTIGSGN